MGPRLAVVLALQWMASLSGFAVASGSEFGVALETGFTGNENQVLKTSSMEHGEITLINTFEAGSVGSSPEGMIDAEENLKFYFMSETEFCNLGVFAVNLFQDHDIQVGNCAGSNPADLSFNITEQVDTDLLQSLNEPQKQSRNLEMPVNKKKLYNRHKKGPKQLSRNEVQDEVKWKNVERCREYRSTKKLTTAEEIAELEKLEEMNLNLKEEEDERKERVAKMKDMYLKLIHEGTIKFI